MTRRVWLGGLACALFAVFGVVATRVHDVHGPVRIDRVVAGKLGSPRLGQLAAWLRLDAAWPDGSAPRAVVYAVPVAAVVVLIGLAGVALRRRDPGAAVLCLAGPVLAVLLTNEVLKPLVDRRMKLSLAYPSGHTTGAAAVGALVLVLGHRWGGWKGLAVASPVALAFPALVGFALIRLNWHYPTDVVGGAAVGAATVLALGALVLGARDRRRPAPPATPAAAPAG